MVITKIISLNLIAKVTKVVNIISLFMKIELSYWKKQFIQAGIKEDIISEYIEYITPLLSKNIPIIFDFNHLSLLLGKDKVFLSRVINSSENFYRSFQIPKKKGGFRNIEAPHMSLLECQEWIYENILKKIATSPEAHGFSFGKSIITNAKVHLNNEEFLKIDIKDFFPSIGMNKIIQVFKKLGYTNYVSFYLASICCKDESLPQGAPTSPILSNIVCIAIDYRLKRLCQKFSINYSRYADDLAFSGTKIPFKFLTYIKEILEDYGFEINDKKTFYQASSKKVQKRILTGISISGSEIKIPREYKRELRKEMHFIKKFGLPSHLHSIKNKNPHYVHSLIGKFQFCLSVEPNNKYAKDSIMYLSKLIQS